METGATVREIRQDSIPCSGRAMLSIDFFDGDNILLSHIRTSGMKYRVMATMFSKKRQSWVFQKKTRDILPVVKPQWSSSSLEAKERVQLGFIVPEHWYTSTGQDTLEIRDVKSGEIMNRFLGIHHSQREHALL